MKYKVLISDTAVEDLKSIAKWISGEYGDKSAAHRVIKELKDKCLSLDMFPESGAFPQDYVLRSAGYRFVLCRNYLVFYTVDNDNNTVTVMAVFSAGRDYNRVMRKFTD